MKLVVVSNIHQRQRRGIYIEFYDKKGPLNRANDVFKSQGVITQDLLEEMTYNL